MSFDKFMTIVRDTEWLTQQQIKSMKQSNGESPDNEASKEEFFKQRSEKEDNELLKRLGYGK